jgi:hypothetical protein
MSGWGGRRNPNGGCVTAAVLALMGAACWAVAIVIVAVVTS